MIIPNFLIDDADVQEALARLQAMGEEMDPILEAIGRQMKTNIQLGFETSTDPYGKPWAPLKIRSGLPLVDKGHLKNSIDYHVDSGKGVTISTPFDWARTHQFGATIKPKNAKVLVFPGPDGTLFAREVTIPARPIFPLDILPQQWGNDLLVVIRDEVRDAWEGR